MNVDKPTSFGELLQTFRKKRKMRQQALANRLGIHRNTIGAWERGDRLPDTRGIVVELSRELHLDDDETRHFLEASLTAWSSYWYVPYRRNPFFTDRSAFLEMLHHWLYAERSVQQSRSYTLTGLGGIGKTQLALEYVYQHATDYYAIFWVVAETIEMLHAGFTAIAAQLQLPEREEQEPEKVVQAVLYWLNTHKEWLLVFDNLEDIALLKPFLPSARQGAVLITTRLHTVEDLSYTLELPAFSDDEGIEFLLRRAKLGGSMASSDPPSPELAEQALVLVQALGGLPLALDQAGAYIERTGCFVLDYVRLLQNHQITLLNERSPIAHHPTSVVKTFQLSFERMQRESQAAADLLYLCAYLSPDAIPEELLTRGTSDLRWALKTTMADAYYSNQLLGEALRYSLIDRQPEHRTVSMHRLVQAVLQDMLSEEGQRIWAQRAVLAVHALFPSGKHGTWLLCERLLPHVLVCATWIERQLVLTPEASDLLDRAGTYLWERGLYADAEPLLLQALALREQYQGAEGAETAMSLLNLGALYWRQGKYEQAESLCQRALSIRERLLGTEHLDTASSLYGLGVLYLEQGKYAEAEPVLKRALTIRERHLGADHLDTATPLNNLGNLYRLQGRYAEAEPLLKRSLAIREQHLGTNHPDLALSFNNLGTLYRAQRQYAEAEPLLKRALAIREQQLGVEHPAMATALNNLATLYQVQGKYAEAEPLLRRALVIREQHLGTDHPDTATTLNNLGALCRVQGKYTEAELLYQRVLAIREQWLGVDHPDIATTLNNLAMLYKIQEKFVEAEPLYRRALAIRERKLGTDHPDLVISLNNLAMLYKIQEKFVEAEPLLKRALIIREQQLGVDHPHTQRMRENYTALVHQLEDGTPS